DLPRDLEIICLKCLQHDPAGRYAAASDLADDLRRFCDGEPVRARPASAGYRFLKWARRRPAEAALVAVSTVAVLALLLGGWWSNVRLLQERDEAERMRAVAEVNAGLARQEHRAAEEARRHESQARRLAEERQKEAQAQRDKAQEHFRQARAAVDLMLTRVSEEQLFRVPGMEPVRRKILDDALTFYQSFLKEKGDDAEVQRSTAQAYWRVGDIQQQLGQPAEALTAYTRAAELQQQLVRRFPTDYGLRHELA